jgi:hypothetical protein
MAHETHNRAVKPDFGRERSLIDFEVGIHVSAVRNEGYFTASRAPSLGYHRIGGDNAGSCACDITFMGVQKLGVKTEQCGSPNKVVLSPVDADLLFAATKYWILGPP